MPFNDAEISTQDGQPIALYLLVWGATVWAYTSADRSIPRTEVINGVEVEVEYLAKAVSDKGMVQGGSSQNNFTIDCPANLPIVPLFRGTPPNETVWLQVRRMHQGEADAPIYWTGTVSNVKTLTQADGQIIGIPITASFKRTGARLCWTRECPHFLYDSGCTVNPEDFRIDAEIITKDGISITVEFPGDIPENGYYRGGFLSWTINEDGTVNRRMIEDNTGETLLIFGLTDGLEIGDIVALYPGCDRTPTMCNDRFDNLPNYGGFDFMPGQTPFGTIIF
jgi:uncharacterized phage protein (TIGR02218 family)